MGCHIAGLQLVHEVRVFALISENLLVSGIYFSICFYVALEKTGSVFRDYRFSGRHFLYGVQIVSSVDLPSPILEKTYVDGIFGAEQRASHTHQAMVVEPYLTFGITVDVLRRAAFDTEVAACAFVHIYLV